MYMQLRPNDLGNPAYFQPRPVQQCDSMCITLSRQFSKHFPHYGNRSGDRGLMGK
ncbi:hypothetical protein BWL13_01285 [Microbacterium oleivorans]|nr:hypothetical protein BWL13_01285 [Microbacterium oleivorans]